MKKMENKKTKKRQYRGFSILEGMMAAFLVSVGMVAALNLMSSSLRETFDSQNQITANLLSQEGIELVRNARDNNWAKGDKAFDGIFPDSSKDNCRINIDPSVVIDCSNSPKQLKLRTVSGFNGIYSYGDGGKDTQFQRRIRIDYFDVSGASTDANGAAYAEITSKVVYDDSFPADNDCNTFSKCVFSKTTLSAWGNP